MLYICSILICKNNVLVFYSYHNHNHTLLFKTVQKYNVFVAFSVFNRGFIVVILRFELNIFKNITSQVFKHVFQLLRYLYLKNNENTYDRYYQIVCQYAYLYFQYFPSNCEVLFATTIKYLFFLFAFFI